ncbi:group II intron reverse transcriptase/maturase, partial [bacterium]|nr:group II intron reverse transcriptase/maturase [bacterium]
MTPLEGWYTYFQYSHKTPFEPLDGWIRMCLRSVLRKRHKGQGRGRGWDHQRWPNACFTKHGLFSTVVAHRSARPSSLRQDHRLESRVRENRTHGSE